MSDRQEPTDEDLIARIASGDREAFALLYRRHRADVHRYAVHVAGTPAAADDVVQDVFVAVIEVAGRYERGRSGVLPWLLGIARNHVRRLRARPVLAPLPLEDSADASQLAVGTDPVHDAARREDASEIRRALGALPLRYREVIVLCDLQELSYEDAARVLQCALGTVRSRLHRGRALLARRLGDRGRDLFCGLPAPRTLL